MFGLMIDNKCRLNDQDFQLLPLDLIQMASDYLIIDSKESYDAIHYLDPSDKVLTNLLRKETLTKKT